MSKVWEIINKFKHFCTTRGWRTSETEDWVEFDNDYHNFLWTKRVSPSSFKAISSERKCVVREGLRYSVVESSHLAWVFSEAPPNDVVETVCENPDLLRRVAIFDISPLLEGKDICNKLNNTDSPVFQEFEAFLRTELKVKVQPLAPYSNSKVRVKKDILPEFA